MNILFVSEVDWMGKVVFDMHLLAEALSLQGHYGVYVIDYESMWGQGDGKGTPKQLFVSRALPNSKVLLIRPSFIRVAGLSRLSAFVSHFYEIERVIEQENIDAIVLYSVPTNGLQAIYWARRFNIPVIFRSIDVLNQLVPYPILRSVTRHMECKVYSSVDRILTITPKLSEYVIGLGANPNKVGILPMPVDTNLFRPLNGTSELRQRWGLGDDDLVILFMGTLFWFSGLDSFIPQFAKIAGLMPNAKLLIVGDGSQRQELEGIIDNLGLQEKVIITGFLPYQDMPHYINLADMCVHTFVDTKATRDIFPGKIVQFLACGKPLVAMALPGVKAVIAGEKQGVVYADTMEEIAVKVFALLKLPERRQMIGQKGLEYAMEFHSHEKVVQQLEAELGQVISKRH